MPQITITYKGSKTLAALHDLSKYFDFVIESTTTHKEKKEKKSEPQLPINYAAHPNVEALAGIWKDKNISLAELRQKAWGERL